MRRTIRPAVEALEGKAMLSGTAASGLAISLRAVTEGTQVVFTFKETNISNHDVRVVTGPSLDGFVVSQGGKAVWKSNAGAVPFFVALQTIHPGQSLTFQSTWDERSNLGNPFNPYQEGPMMTGTFTVDNGLDTDGHATTFSIPNSPTPPRPIVGLLHIASKPHH